MTRKNQGRKPDAGHPWKQYEQLPLGISPTPTKGPHKPATEDDDRYSRAEFEADQLGQTGDDLARGYCHYTPARARRR